MQLLIAQRSLAKALQVIGRVVPKRPIAPAVGGVTITADAGEVRLFATDLHNTMEVRLPAVVHLSGRATVSARVIAGVVATLPDDEVLLSLSESKESLRITAGPAAFRLPTITTEIHPFRPPRVADLLVSAPHMIDLVQRTTFCAVDSDELSPFAGVYLSGTDDALTLAATDNYQLAYYQLPAAVPPAPATPAPGSDEVGGEQSAGARDAVLPTSSLTTVARAIAQMAPDADVAIHWNERVVWFCTADLSCAVRRLDVAYPDLSRYMGAIAGVRIEASRDQLLLAVRQVASVGQDEHRRLSLTVDGDRLHLASAPEEQGEAHTVIHLASHHPRRRIWLDARRLVSALKAQPQEQVALYVSEPLAPVAIAPADETVKYRAVLTPLRVDAIVSEAVM